MFSADDTYFQDQPSSRHFLKRRRKRPDELPQSLRYAQLNPKIASFYKDKAEDGEQTGLSFADDGLKDGGLPEIPSTFSHIRNQLLTGLLTDFDLNRTVLTEKKSLAPTILEQLARLLPLLKNTNRKIVLPRSLEMCLHSGYDDLVYDARHVKREWQVLDNQIQHNLSIKEKQQKESEATSQAGQSNKTSKPRIDVSDSDEDHAPAVDADGRPVTKSKKRFITRNIHSQPTINVEPPPRSRGGGLGQRKNRSDSASKKPFTAPGGKQGEVNRLAVLRGSGDEPTSDNDAAQSIKSHVPQPYSLQTLTFNLTNYENWEDKGCHVFCVDKESNNDHPLEWVVKRLNRASKNVAKSQAHDTENHYTQVAYTRYYDQTFSEKQIIRAANEKLGIFNTVVKGGKPKIPTVSKKSKGKVFCSQITDGSKTIYYENGEIAVVTSFAGDRKYYTLAYDKSAPLPIEPVTPVPMTPLTPMIGKETSPSTDLIATFTPTGIGSCRNPEIGNSLLLTEEGVTLINSDETTELFTWPINPGNKFNQPIVFEISKYMYLKIFGKYAITLSITPILNHNIKLSVGRIEGATTPDVESLLPLKLLETEYSSTTALELLQKSKKLNEKDKPQRRLDRNGSRRRPSDRVKPVPIPRRVKTPKGKDANTRNVEFVEQSVVVLDFSKYEKDFARLKNKAKHLVDDWMDVYRLAIGMSAYNFKSFKANDKWRPGGLSAKSMPPDTQDSNADDLATTPLPIPAFADVTMRITSAPSGISLQRHTPALQATPELVADEEPSLVVRLSAKESRSPLSSAGRVKPAQSSQPKLPVTRPTGLLTSVETPKIQGLLSQWTMANHYQCAAALRQQLLGKIFHGSSHVCRCPRRHVPYITDVELETFIKQIVPPRQLIVIAIVSSLFQEQNEEMGMLDRMHAEQNGSRTHVCMQSKIDAYRVFKYDVATAWDDSDHTQPLLMTKHNAVPGMYLIFQGGRLLFCDHIFNGYGNARRDFQKQLVDCRQLALRGFQLPPDFKFSPARGRHGPRSPWGGQIGGVPRRVLIDTAAKIVGKHKSRVISPDDDGSVSSLEFHLSKNVQSVADDDEKTSTSLIGTLNRKFQKFSVGRFA